MQTPVRRNEWLKGFVFLYSEVSSKKFSASDAKGPRSFSRFLVRLSELSVRMIMKQISLLLRHLESEVSSGRFGYGLVH